MASVSGGTGVEVAAAPVAGWLLIATHFSFLVSEVAAAVSLLLSPSSSEVTLSSVSASAPVVVSVSDEEDEVDSSALVSMTTAAAAAAVASTLVDDDEGDSGRDFFLTTFRSSLSLASRSAFSLTAFASASSFY